MDTEGVSEHAEPLPLRGTAAGVLSGLLKCTAPSSVQQGAVSAENTEATVTEAPTQKPRDREATAVIPAGTGELSVTS